MSSPSDLRAGAAQMRVPPGLAPCLVLTVPPQAPPRFCLNAIGVLPARNRGKVDAGRDR